MSSFTRTQKVLGFMVWLALSFVASAIGAMASVQARSFYADLTQPDWAPPGWLFGPVWTVLFLLMAIAAWLVWLQGGVRQQRLALSLFVGQLVLNALWTWLFFGWTLGAAAFAEILLLLGFIAATLIAFWRVRPVAGALMVPYILWVSFATALNLSLWQLNPAVLG